MPADSIFAGGSLQEEWSGQRSAREEENRELAQLEQDMTDLVDVFGEVNKLVHEQGEVIGNLWALNYQFLIQ